MSLTKCPPSIILINPRLNPKSIDSQKNIAINKSKIGLFSEGEEKLIVLKNIFKNNEELLLALADLYRINKNYDKAIHYYTKIINSNNETELAISCPTFPPAPPPPTIRTCTVTGLSLTVKDPFSKNVCECQ